MIYRIYLSLDSPGGHGGWSETTEPRKPMKGADRFYPTDHDCYPLGPSPKELVKNIETHWMLFGYVSDVMPLSFNRISTGHFSGSPILCQPMAEIYRDHAKGDCELIRIPNIWSRKLKQEVTEPFFIVNVYRKLHTLDLERSGGYKVINPKLARNFGVSTNPRALRLLSDFQGASGVWRDGNTSDWFCDDIFRSEIEAIAPSYYEFYELQS